MEPVTDFVNRNKGLVESLFGRIDESYSQLVERIREIAETPAPTFQEAKRTRLVTEMFGNAGLRDVHSLGRGSVLGFTHSGQDGNTLLLAAHIDTVFPMETDLTTRIEGSTLYGPGTGDNATNVAAVITLAEILDELSIDPGRNIAFCGTVREEGIGNLGGIAEVTEALGKAIGTVIAVDGHMTSVMHRSQAIRRYEVKTTGPGGHSWEHFRTPSAIHELARIITALAAIDVPDDPKTTFNVGTVRGGRSVNAIAQEAAAEVDLRSLETDKVEWLESELLRLVRELPSGAVTADPESDLVRIAVEAAAYLGNEVRLTAASTDAALSLDRGIPSVAFGTYNGKGTHTLEEQVDLDSLVPGLKWLALTVLILGSDP
jgi:tripeptide aminopeptidase